MDDTRRNDQEENKDEDVIASETKQSQEDDSEEQENVQSEFEAMTQLAQQLENQLKRSLADYQNLQKRVQEEKVSWIKMANKDLLLKMLPVLDTLMLAHKHLADKGLELSIHQFLQALKDEGVTKIETVGQEFNPNTMEATGTTEGEEGKVIDEVRAGFMYYEAVLRPAQVIVGN